MPVRQTLSAALLADRLAMEFRHAIRLANQHPEFEWPVIPPGWVVIMDGGGNVLVRCGLLNVDPGTYGIPVDEPYDGSQHDLDEGPCQFKRRAYGCKPQHRQRNRDRSGKPNGQ